MDWSADMLRVPCPAGYLRGEYWVGCGCASTALIPNIRQCKDAWESHDPSYRPFLIETSGLGSRFRVAGDGPVKPELMIGIGKGSA